MDDGRPVVGLVHTGRLGRRDLGHAAGAQAQLEGEQVESGRGWARVCHPGQQTGRWEMRARLPTPTFHSHSHSHLCPAPAPAPKTTFHIHQPASPSPALYAAPVYIRLQVLTQQDPPVGFPSLRFHTQLFYALSAALCGDLMPTYLFPPKDCEHVSRSPRWSRDLIEHKSPRSHSSNNTTCHVSLRRLATALITT